MLQRYKHGFEVSSQADEVLRFSPGSSRIYVLFVKRGFDFSLALILLTLLSPVLLCIAGIVSLDRAKPIFAHERVGMNGRRFKCYKFRTMRPDADDLLEKILECDAAAEAQWNKNHKISNDPRITYVGKWLRQTSLDELPQLLNVLLGDMSLVGPRPITYGETKRYKEHLPKYLALRPGLTGLWQVYGRGTVDYCERIDMDVNYFQKISFVGDIRLICMTFNVILQRKGQ
ncbi:sugar transferase [Sulfitobacter sp. 916]|uniref:sugar transferase n=1 Tax=Sulfitobacter sp. 916 TaxID=3368559 RepID=UPI0037450572